MSGSSSSDDDGLSDHEVANAREERKRYLMASHVLMGGKIKRKSRSKSKAQSTGGENVAIAVRDEIVCNADHSLITWATTAHCRTGRAYYIPVKEDSGTEVNWIAPELVQRLGFEIETEDQASIFRNFQGQEFEAKQWVTVSLTGRSPKSQHMECFVAPEGFPLDGIVLGSKFSKAKGAAETLFLSQPADPAFLMMQSPKSESEQRAIEIARAERDRRSAQLQQQQAQASSSNASPNTANRSPTGHATVRGNSDAARSVSKN